MAQSSLAPANMDLQTLLKTGADQSCFLAQPSSALTSGGGEEVGIREVPPHERHAEELLLQYCSLPEVRRHPRQATMEAQSRAWLTDLYTGRLPADRVQRLLDTRLDTLGCVFYPHGCSDARSLTLIKLIHWFFILDDVLDDPHLLGHNYDAAIRFSCRHFKAMFGDNIMEAQAVGLIGTNGYDDVEDADNNQQSITILLHDATAASGTTQESEYVASLAKAQQELVIEVGVQWAQEMHAEGMSPRQLGRLREAVAEYLVGITSIVRLRQEKRLPELEEYIRIRRMDGADKLALLGCEFDLGIELDDATLAHPLMKELHAATADHLLWLNDLLSFNREYHNEDYVSLLAVLHYNNSKARTAKDGNVAAATMISGQPAQMVDFKEALTEARAMIKACDQERVRLVREIAMWKPELQPYVDATHYTISGITFWTLWSSRYQTRGPI